MSYGDSSGRIVVVTGAAGGIGAAIAARFVGEERVVALWDRDPAVLETAAALDNSQKTTAVHGAVVDITNADAVHAEFDRLTAAHGRVEVLVHAAGVLVGGSALELDPADWARCLTVNATGTMLVTQRAATEMAAAGNGSIVVVSSNAAATPRVAMAAYGAAKAAATAFTRSLALQVAPLGVRVNLVSPGSTDTTMLRDMFGGAPLDDAAETALLDGDPAAYRLGIPLRRIAAPADIASAIHFLASDGARHITMHDLRVDGGATLDM
ncbi:SDR family oxidoreductase [Nocardia sp. IBHARD005]|uniref:SDR family oxidoreductase n=1 Tax=Nocardia sp. IBHARD005 TaxID=3457765 RepID=UPI0040591949